ncbi:hypothetical protein [Streptomyces iakyrus]|uniref:hypothetical protein n=1 Tax=Streptomyces iakyrus TaxID=68219 RepID=UPI0033CD4BD7
MSLAARVHAVRRADRLGSRTRPRTVAVSAASRSTQRMPFPVPDERARYSVDSYADMHDLVEDLVVPAGAREAAATVLWTAR